MMASNGLWILSIAFFTISSALDTRHCNRPLGMEAGRIKDDQITVSSSFDLQSTGPQNSRLRWETGSGAWCPLSQINDSSHEWIQIDFPTDVVITAIETQGRYDKGRGLEFAPGYLVEYWRTSLGRWARYRDAQLNEIIVGNTDTSSTALRVLDGALIAKTIRLIPVSEVTRTVCMRVELHGCEYRDTLLSYSAPVGSRLDALDLRDAKYDGDERDNGLLVGGIGKLFDGVVGNDDFETVPGPWLGYRKDVHGPVVALEFTFGQRRNFTAISVYTSNAMRLGAALFSAARIHFSAGDDDIFSPRIVEFYQKVDIQFESARWVRIPINNRLARRIRLELVLSSADWLVISEVKFESNNVAFHLPISVLDDESLMTSSDGVYWGIVSSGTSSNVPSSVFIYVTLGIFICATLGAFLIVCWCQRARSRLAKATMLGKMSDDPRRPVYYGFGISNGCYTGNRSKRYGPTPEKLSIDEEFDEESAYADPDAEVALLYSSPADETPESAFEAPDLPAAAFKFLKHIGEGEFGTVSLCQLGSTLVAVKTVKGVEGSDAVAKQDEFRREIGIAAKLRHPNVLKVIATSLGQNPAFYAVEFMAHGDLKHYVASHPAIPMDRLICFATQISAGMAYLESCNFVHRDLAARNCLVAEDGTVKVSDFGMTRSLYSMDYYKVDGQFSMPIRWMAPECVMEGKFSHATDVWSLGVTIWEVLSHCREKPFGGLTDDEVIDNLQTAYETGILKHTLTCHLTPYAEVTTACWQVRPANRPTLTTIHTVMQRLQCAYTLSHRPPPPNLPIPQTPDV